MRILFLVALLPTITFSLSQVKLNCFDKVFYKKTDDFLSIYINDNVIQINQPNDLLYDGVKVKCISNYLGLTYNFNDGIANNLIINIFKYENNAFYLKNILSRYSTKREDLWSISNCDKIKLETFKINLDRIIIDEKCKDEKSISLITGYQEGREVNDISYYKLILNTFKKKKYEDVQLFTNEFVVEELGIENLNVNEINNIAFFAYKSKAFYESIYILNKIIAKFPNRVVAYLNLADNYWALKQNDKAIENYKKYIQLMKEQKKDLKKIPKYVFERIKG